MSEAIYEVTEKKCLPSCKGRHEMAEGEEVKLFLEQPPKNPNWPKWVKATVESVTPAPGGGRIYQFKFDTDCLNSPGVIFDECDVTGVGCWTCCDPINACPEHFADIETVNSLAGDDVDITTEAEALEFLSTYIHTITDKTVHVSFGGLDSDPEWLLRACHSCGEKTIIVKKPDDDLPEPIDPCDNVIKLFKTLVAESQYVDFTIPLGYTAADLDNHYVVRLVDTANELSVNNITDLGNGLIRVELDGSPNDFDTHQVHLKFDNTCASVDQGSGGDNYDSDGPDIDKQFCSGVNQITQFGDGNITVEPNATCEQLPGIECAGQLCVNVKAGDTYYFRNTGGATLNDLLTPGSSEFDTFKGDVLQTVLDNFASDPTNPNSGAYNATPRFYAGEGSFLFPGDFWREVSTPGSDIGTTALAPYFRLAVMTNGQICLPAGVEYYAGDDSGFDSTDQTTYDELPYNKDQSDASAADVVCNP